MFATNDPSRWEWADAVGGMTRIISSKDGIFIDVFHQGQDTLITINYGGFNEILLANEQCQVSMMGASNDCNDVSADQWKSLSGKITRLANQVRAK